MRYPESYNCIYIYNAKEAPTRCSAQLDLHTAEDLTSSSKRGQSISWNLFLGLSHHERTVLTVWPYFLREKASYDRILPLEQAKLACAIVQKACVWVVLN